MTIYFQSKIYASFKIEGRKHDAHLGTLKFTQISCLKNKENQYLTEIGFIITAPLGGCVEFPQEPKGNKQGPGRKDFSSPVEPQLSKN